MTYIRPGSNNTRKTAVTHSLKAFQPSATKPQTNIISVTTATVPVTQYLIVSFSIRHTTKRLLEGKLFLIHFGSGADVKLRLYAIDAGEAKLATELKVPYQAVKNVKQGVRYIGMRMEQNMYMGTVFRQGRSQAQRKIKA
jgi:hypothetical protein